MTQNLSASPETIPSHLSYAIEVSAQPIDLEAYLAKREAAGGGWVMKGLREVRTQKQIKNTADGVSYCASKEEFKWSGPFEWITEMSDSTKFKDMQIRFYVEAPDAVITKK